MREVFAKLIIVLVIASSCCGWSPFSKRAVISRVDKIGYSEFFYAKFENNAEIIIEDTAGYELWKGVFIDVEQYTVNLPNGNKRKAWRIVGVSKTQSF